MAKNCQNWAQNEVLGHFLEIASLDFAKFSYIDRQAWYLTGYGGLQGWKKYFGQIWAKIGQILAMKFIFFRSFPWFKLILLDGVKFWSFKWLVIAY